MANGQTPIRLFEAAQVWDGQSWVVGTPVPVREGITTARVVVSSLDQVAIMPLVRGYGEEPPASDADWEKVPLWGDLGQWLWGGGQGDAEPCPNFAFHFQVGGASWFTVALKSQTSLQGYCRATCELGQWSTDLLVPTPQVYNVQGTVDAVIPAYAQPVQVEVVTP